MKAISQSRALWNRDSPDLQSDEILAQLLDRGELEVFREPYQLAKCDPVLRRRIANIVANVPLALPHFWLPALSSLGENVQWDQGRSPIAERRRRRECEIIPREQ